MPPRYSSIVRLLRHVMKRVGALTCLQPHALVPIPVRRQPGWDAGRRRPSPSSVWLPLLTGIVLLAASPATAASPTLPAANTNFYDLAVQAHYRPMEVGTLRGNSDFPVALLVNTAGDQTKAVLLGFDVRNEKDTWSFSQAPVIFIAFIAVYADEATFVAVYVDVGFADQGKASGRFAVVDPVDDATLRELLKAAAPGAGWPA